MSTGRCIGSEIGAMRNAAYRSRSLRHSDRLIFTAKLLQLSVCFSAGLFGLRLQETDDRHGEGTRGAGGRRLRSSRHVVTRFRVFVLAVVAALAAMVGVSLWRMRSVSDLPDVGDPFDLAAARRVVVMSDEDNAYVQYKEARRQLTRFTSALAKSVQAATGSWSKAGTNVRDYLEENRPALETWRAGTERSDAMYHQPGELAVDTLLPVVQDLRTLGRLAELEGSRHEERGEMDEAWAGTRPCCARAAMSAGGAS